jgi:hypothetical protein
MLNIGKLILPAEIFMESYFLGLEYDFSIFASRHQQV